jgi:hypothetical protein
MSAFLIRVPAAICLFIMHPHTSHNNTQILKHQARFCLFIMHPHTSHNISQTLKHQARFCLFIMYPHTSHNNTQTLKHLARFRLFMMHPHTSHNAQTLKHRRHTPEPTAASLRNVLYTFALKRWCSSRDISCVCVCVCVCVCSNDAAHTVLCACGRQSSYLAECHRLFCVCCRSVNAACPQITNGLDYHITHTSECNIGCHQLQLGTKYCSRRSAAIGY